MSLPFKKILFYTLLVYAILGFIVLPLVLKPQIEKAVAQELNATVAVESLYINPFLMKVSLEGVRLRNLKDEELLHFKALELDVELYSLFYGAIHIAKLSLVEPELLVVYDANKQINLQGLLKESEAPKQESNESISLPRIIVDEVSIVAGEIHYEDYTLKEPFYFDFHNIGVALLDADTDESAPLQTKFRFYTTLGDGGFVDFKSNISSLQNFKADGSLNFEASKLYTEWKYIRDMLSLEVADGKISFHTDYSFALADINATKLSNFELGVAKLRIKPKESFSDILNINSFTVSQTTIEPLQQKVHVGKVALNGLRLVAQREPDGGIDWSRYVRVERNESKSSEPLRNESVENNQSVQSKPWDLLVSNLYLENIALIFNDTFIQPNVTSSIEELKLHAQDITLLGENPFAYNLSLKLNNSGSCSSQGVLAHKELNLQSYVSCQGIEITHFNPYIEDAAKKALKKFDLSLADAKLNFNANTHILMHDDALTSRVYGANVVLNKLALKKASTKESLSGFANLSVLGIDADTSKRYVSVENITLNELYANVVKESKSKLNIDELVLAKESKFEPSKQEAKAQEESGYEFKLKHFAINKAALNFRDNSLEKPAKNGVKNIFANVYNISSSKSEWIDYTLSMQLASKGNLAAQGKVRQEPLTQKGSFALKNISLKALNPYIQEQAFVALTDGRVSVKGKTTYAKSQTKPDLQVQGSMKLESLFVNETLQNTQLLSLGQLRVPSYTLELLPDRLYVDELSVDSFYVDASIDENKTLNFSKLQKHKDTNTTEIQSEANATQKDPFPYRIARIDVNSGSAKFADYSIPIKFATNIHDLAGSMYALSNSAGETSYVDISGEVDKYASTRLKGSVDSANPKAYTDLDFNFKNLSLNSFSGYSLTFAGHEIDSGKLYLDLGYDIVDSELLGSNSLVIEQIQLGKESEDENVTVLPLGFVIGLLEDSEGVIDIDMPVEGNLDEPDFKYGQVVLKAFGTLITKAVTSPFKFLGAALGIDGDDLEFIAFDPGSALIAPPQREKLDTLITLMQKKPKISLAVAPEYALRKDTEALQMQKLIALVVTKSGVKNIQDHESIMTIDMLEEIYSEQKDAKDLEALRKRLQEQYKDTNKYERTYNKELIKLCRDMQSITQAQLETLARQRADAIVSYLVEEKMLEQSRVERKELQILEDSDEEFVKLLLEIEVK